MVSGDEFWRYAAGVRQARRVWALRTAARPDEAALRRPGGAASGGARGRAADDQGARRPEWAGFIGNLGLWVDLVRVPPSGTWERRRADRLALAEDWVGPDDATEDGGPGAPRAGVPARRSARRPGRTSPRGRASPSPTRSGAREALSLVRYRDEDGRELVDLPDAPLPGPGHTRARPLPAALGRQPARPCPADRPPAGGPPADASSRRRTRSRSGPSSSMAGSSPPGRSRTAGSSSIRSKPVAPATPTRSRTERAALEAFHA